MAFLMGSFLGSAAKTGYDTYTGLKKLRMEQDEQDARNEARDRADEDRENFKAVQAKIGQQDYTAPLQQATGLNQEQAASINQYLMTLPPDQRAGLAQQVVAGSANGTDQSVAPTPMTYSRAQAMQDYAAKANDPEKAVQFASLGEKMQKEDQVRGVLQAQTKMAGGDVMGGLQQIAAIHGTVPDGYTSQAVMGPDGKPSMVVTNDKNPNDVQTYDVSHTLAQNLLTTRALAGIDPTTYMPVHQAALEHWATATNQQNAHVETGRHNKVSEGVAQQTADQTGDYYDTQREHLERADKTNENYRTDQVDQRREASRERLAGVMYAADHRGTAGKVVDQNKAALEWAKANPGLVGYVPEGQDKAVIHPDLMGLGTRAFQVYGEGPATQLLTGVQQKARDASLRPDGTLDTQKYTRNLTAMSQAALTQINNKTGGVNPGASPPSGNTVVKTVPHPAGLDTKRGIAAGEAPKAPVNGMKAAPAEEKPASPPPQYTQQGLSRVVNPAYTDYVKKYGAPKTDDAPALPKGSASEKARADAYDPFKQNRVR